MFFIWFWIRRLLSRALKVLFLNKTYVYFLGYCFSSINKLGLNFEGGLNIKSENKKQSLQICYIIYPGIGRDYLM